MIDKAALEQEREKLDKLIDDALKRGAAIAQDEDIQRQARLMEQLMEKIEAETPAP